MADSEDVEPVCTQGQLYSSQYLGICVTTWYDRRDFTRTALSPCCTLPPLVSRRGWLFVPLCQRLIFYKKFLLFLIKKKYVIPNQRSPNTPRKRKSQFGPVRILFLLLERKGNFFIFLHQPLASTHTKMGVAVCFPLDGLSKRFKYSLFFKLGFMR